MLAWVELLDTLALNIHDVDNDIGAVVVAFSPCAGIAYSSH